MSDWAGLGWLVVLLAGNAFFVAGEFAIMGARRSQIEPLVEKGSKRAKTALWAMEHVNQMLAVCQLGITVCSLLILNVSEPALHHLLYGPLTTIGIPETVSSTVAFIVALLVVTFLHVTFGEMVPKNFSVSLADKMVLILAPPLVFFDKLLLPVVKLLNSLANGLLKLFGIQPQNELSSAYTLEEVQQIVAESTKSGLVEDDSGLLSGALEFSDYKAAQVMVPIADVVALEEGQITPREFEKAVGRTGFSRFAMADAKGRFIGYLHLKDVLDLADYDRPIPVTKMRALANVSASAEIEDALEIMQKTSSHVARVIDQDGETVGMLFLEDVIEVLVGEIHDATQAQGRRRQNMHEGE
ncbi:hemolysin family protein [Micrococcoides hystricis]|uniref:Hemolysin family protein n=1 Tax=Micrococcoides hystricis TaxID=1572761 RepID=A0ABV6PD51_9MICC